MSNLNEMIEAARGQNPSKFESLFEAEVSERLATVLTEKRADIVSEMFGIGGDETETEESVNSEED